MSRVFERTSMISEERMLNTATRTMIESTKNIATRSTCSASNRLALIDFQSLTTACPASLSASGARISWTVSASVGLDLDHADRVAGQQQRLRVGDRHDDEGLVVIVDADLEDRGDGVADLARHRAERRRRGPAG